MVVKTKNEYLNYLIQCIIDNQLAMKTLVETRKISSFESLVKELIDKRLKQSAANFSKILKALITPFDKDDLLTLSSMLVDFLYQIDEISFYLYLTFDEKINIIDKEYLLFLNNAWDHFASKMSNVISFNQIAIILNDLKLIEQELLSQGLYYNRLKNVFFNENNPIKKEKRLMIISSIHKLHLLMIKILRTMINAIIKSI